MGRQYRPDSLAPTAWKSSGVSPSISLTVAVANCDWSGVAVEYTCRPWKVRRPPSHVISAVLPIVNDLFHLDTSMQFATPKTEVERLIKLKVNEKPEAAREER